MALDFPDSSASPWTAPNGVIYTWNVDGYWEAAPTATDYLKLDATNAPVTGPLTFDTVNTSDDNFSISSDANNLSAKGAASIPLQIGYKGGDNEYGVSASLNSSSGFDKNYTFSQITVGTQATGSYEFNGYTISKQSSSIGEIDDFRGYSAFGGHEDSLARNTYGFYSNINTNTATRSDGLSSENFNFYSHGTAPNYLGHTVAVGGDVITNGISNSIHLQNQYSGVRVLGAQIEISRVGASAGNAPLHLNRIGSPDGHVIRFYNSGATVDSIKLDGSGGISYGTSDYRLKENIVDLPSAIDAIKSLRPVNYNFTAYPGKTRPGFIAHEVAETLPVAVTGEKDAEEIIGTYTDPDGVVETEVTEPEAIPFGATWVQTGTRPVYQGVDQTKLIPLLTKALQEALERIEQLEAQIGGTN